MIMYILIAGIPTVKRMHAAHLYIYSLLMITGTHGKKYEGTA